MTSATMKAKIVRVKIEADNVGLYYATSPDLKGLLVAEPTVEELERAIPRAVADLYAACGVEVIVTKAEDGCDEHAPYIAFPTELARRELKRVEHVGA